MSRALVMQTSFRLPAVVLRWLIIAGMIASLLGTFHWQLSWAGRLSLDPTTTPALSAQPPHPNLPVSPGLPPGPLLLGSFIQQSLLTAADGAAGTEFGAAVALSRDGNTLLVGARFSNAAYVFVRNGGGWTQQSKLVPTPAVNGNAFFGYSVALSDDGNLALVGAPAETVGANSFQGAVYVFKRSGTNWSQQNHLTANDGASNDFFGSAVALNEGAGEAFVGASNKTIGANLSQGAAYTFLNSGTNWLQESRLTADDGAPGDQFGSSIALNRVGSLALIGAYNKTITIPDRRGAAYIFSCVGPTCTQQARLTAPNGDQTATFGNAVSLSGDGATALVGAAVGGPDSEGTAYVFTSSGSTWNQQARLAASDGVGGDNFGFALALSDDGNKALVGAPFKAVTNTSSQGQTYVFERAGSSWSQQQFFSSSDTNAGENFGYSISLSLDAKTALIGAPGRLIGNNSGQGGVFDFKLLVPSTTTLVSTPNPSTYGQSVTFTATVTPITATGSVTFKFDMATPVTVSLAPSNNVAAYVTSTLPVGQHLVTATYNGDNVLAPSQSATLTQIVTAGPPASIVAVSGSGQSTNISTTFAAPLVAQVTDAGSNPISGTSVTFSAPSSGPSGTFVGGSTVFTGSTDASGRITSTAFTANGIAGSYNVTATVAGVAQPALFQLTNLNGCNPLVVTSTADDGTTCGTLRTAIAAAATSPNKQITLDLPAGSVISLTTGLTLSADVAITTTATVSPGPNATPPIILQGVGPTSGDGLTLTTNNRLYGLWVRGFSGRQIVFPSASHAILRWVKVSQT